MFIGIFGFIGSYLALYQFIKVVTNGDIDGIWVPFKGAMYWMVRRSLASQISMEKMRRYSDEQAAKFGEVIHRSASELVMYPRIPERITDLDRYHKFRLRHLDEQYRDRTRSRPRPEAPLTSEVVSVKLESVGPKLPTLKEQVLSCIRL